MPVPTATRTRPAKPLTTAQVDALFIDIVRTSFPPTDPLHVAPPIVPPDERQVLALTPQSHRLFLGLLVLALVASVVVAGSGQTRRHLTSCATTNTFSYVNGNPLNMVDPNGHWGRPTWAKASYWKKKWNATTKSVRIGYGKFKQRQIEGAAAIDMMTPENPVGRHAVGVQVGLRNTLGKAADGLITMAGTAVAHPVKSVDTVMAIDKFSGEHPREFYGGLLSGITKDTREDWAAGRWGEAVGDVLGIGATIAGPGGFSKARTAGEAASVLPEGVIYLRTDSMGGKPYIGQSKSMERYELRRQEHQRAHPEADFDYEIIRRAKPGTETGSHGGVLHPAIWRSDQQGEP